MNMLSLQVDNLRLMAKLVRDYDYKEISRMLREAADTIESLRKSVGSESRYFKLFGTPERAALTLVRMCTIGDGSCAGCPILGSNVDDCSDALLILDWLKGDA